MSPLLYAAGTTALGVAGSAAGVLVYRWRRKIDSQANAEDEGDPIKLLKEELAKSEQRTASREAELAALRTADQKERAVYVEALTEIKNTMKEMATDIREHRAEEKDRSRQFHERLNGMDNRLTVIETRLERP